MDGGKRPCETTPGTASSSSDSSRRVDDVAVVVGQDAAVGRGGGVAPPRTRQRVERGGQPEGQELERDRGMQPLDRLVRGDDDHEPVGRRGHDALAGVGASPSLDQPAGRVDLVGSVDGQVEAVDVGEGTHVEAMGDGQLRRGRRRGDAGDGQPAPGREPAPAGRPWCRCPGRRACRPRPGSPRPTRRPASRRRCRVRSRRAHAQLRGTSFQASSLSVRTSPGRPSTRSPRMLRMTSDVPPSMELARTRRKSLCTSGEPMPTSPGRTIG